MGLTYIKTATAIRRHPELTIESSVTGAVGADLQTALAHRELAKTCFRQAAGTTNPQTAEALRVMGHEYLAKARAIDPSLERDDF